MQPQLLALVTAMAWGIGGYFELTLKTLTGMALTIGGIAVLTID